jgi:hypothetical protein
MAILFSRQRPAGDQYLQTPGCFSLKFNIAAEKKLAAQSS